MQTKYLIISIFLLFSLFSLQLHAQDVIILKDGRELKVLIDKLEDDKVFFKKIDDADIVHFVFKEKISKIFFKDGSVMNLENVIVSPPVEEKNNTLNTTPTTNIQNDMYLRGANDAAIYYHKYKGAGTGTLLTTMLLNPVFGLIPAVACSTTKPTVNKILTPNMELLKNPNYVNGYLQAAKKIKSQKVWKNFGIGTGVFIGIILLAYSSE